MDEKRPKRRKDKDNPIHFPNGRTSIIFPFGTDKVYCGNC